MPGIPWSLRVLLLGQTREEGQLSLADLRVEDEMVLQHVVRSNKTRDRLIQEAAGNFCFHTSDSGADNVHQ